MVGRSIGFQRYVKPEDNQVPARLRSFLRVTRVSPRIYIYAVINLHYDNIRRRHQSVIESIVKTVAGTPVRI